MYVFDSILFSVIFMLKSYIRSKMPAIELYYIELYTRATFYGWENRIFFLSYNKKWVA
jgi:hypothetical protein